MSTKVPELKVSKSAPKTKPATVVTTAPVVATTPDNHADVLDALGLSTKPVDPKVVKLQQEVTALKSAVKAKQHELDVAMGKTTKATGKMTLVDAAVQLLGEYGPMKCSAVVAKAAELGLWETTSGATPDATLYSAIITNIAKHGAASRFIKTAPGTFALRS